MYSRLYDSMVSCSFLYSMEETFFDSEILSWQHFRLPYKQFDQRKQVRHHAPENGPKFLSNWA